jgi:hypothetical protein
MERTTLAIIVATLLGGCLFATRAEADMTTNQFLSAYESASPDRKPILDSLADSLQEGMGWANSAVTVVQHRKPIYCQPQDMVLTGPQVVDMLRGEVAKNSAIGPSPLGAGIVEALLHTFPCPKISD